jgi:hypothetical protein
MGDAAIPYDLLETIVTLPSTEARDRQDQQLHVDQAQEDLAILDLAFQERHVLQVAQHDQVPVVLQAPDQAEEEAAVEGLQEEADKISKQKQ